MSVLCYTYFSGLKDEAREEEIDVDCEMYQACMLLHLNGKPDVCDFLPVLSQAI